MVASRLRCQRLAREYALPEICDGLASVDKLACAGNEARLNRLEIVDFDFNRGTDFVFAQGRVERYAHAGVGERIDDSAVHHLVWIQMMCCYDDAALAETTALFFDCEAYEVGEWVIHRDVFLTYLMFAL